jgi:hypothetical protein
MTDTRPKDPPATEAEMLDLLERHFARPGNGGSGEYAFMRQVRNAAGFDAKRTFDAVCVGLWPSRGHDIHVIEVKVARSDWLRELAKPAKAEDAAKVADRFSVAAPRGVLDLAEVPATWGYIEISGGTVEEYPIPPLFPGDEERTGTRVVGRKVRTVRAAPLLRPAEECRGPIPRSFLVPMLRAAGAVPDTVDPHQAVIDAAVRDAVREAEARVRTAERERVERKDETVKAAARALQLVRDTLGIYWATPDELATRLREIRERADVGGAPDRASLVVAQARDRIAAVLNELDLTQRRLAEAQREQVTA